jgi:hypothetical protein
MRSTTKFLALAGLIVGFGGDASAQNPGARPQPRAPQGDQVAPRRPGSVTAMLDARRQLDLTPRQVSQLDSLERGLHAERQRIAEANRPAMDSMRQRVRSGAPRDAQQREAMRAEAEQRRAAMRPEMDRLRQRDSVATAAADRILNDTQRTKWREMQAERRGFERGMREGRGRQQGAQGRSGNRGPQQMRRPMGEGRGGEGRPGGQGGQPAPGRRP